MSADILLRGRNITRRWGGLTAVNKVSLELERGTVHAVIGSLAFWGYGVWHARGRRLESGRARYAV